MPFSDRPGTAFSMSKTQVRSSAPLQMAIGDLRLVDFLVCRVQTPSKAGREFRCLAPKAACKPWTCVCPSTEYIGPWQLSTTAMKFIRVCSSSMTQSTWSPHISRRAVMQVSGVLVCLAAVGCVMAAEARALSRDGRALRQMASPPMSAGLLRRVLRADRLE